MTSVPNSFSRFAWAVFRDETLPFFQAEPDEGFSILSWDRQNNTHVTKEGQTIIQVMDIAGSLLHGHPPERIVCSSPGSVTDHDDNYYNDDYYDDDERG